MSDFEGQHITVGVRIGPGGSDKNDILHNPLILKTDGFKTITLTNCEYPGQRDKQFEFAQIYWSFDGWEESQSNHHIVPILQYSSDAKYCDQVQIFDSIGRQMARNAWNGYNSSLICFGESGSGASWTLFGNATNKGIIQLLSSDLLKGVKEKDRNSPLGSGIEIKLTMMQVYENQVHDLLAGSCTKYRTAIKFRNHPKRGFYVEGLRSVVISSVDEIQQRLDEGQTTRALNTISFSLSRSQTATVVGLSLLQKYRNLKGDEVTMSACIDFYDLPLAVVSTVPLKHLQLECKLHGNLAQVESTDIKLPHEDNARISFPNIALSRLLEKALSGNCKTYVIAHCIPVESNYDSTLRALNLANKLQGVSTHPIMNEEMTSKLIKELKLENDSLKKLLLSNGDFERNEFFAWSERLRSLLLSSSTNNKDTEEFKRQLSDDIKSQIRENEKEIKTLNQAHEDKLKMARLDKQNTESLQNAKKLEMEKKHRPYVMNLSEDAQLNGRIIHIIPLGVTEFGLAKANDTTILIPGPGVKQVHGTFASSSNAKEGKVTIKPNGLNCVIRINGKQIFAETTLYHNDRIALRGSNLWLFQNPRETWSEKNLISKITFPSIQEEIVLNSSDFMTFVKSMRGAVPVEMKKVMCNFWPVVDEANAMCESIEEPISFELTFVPDIQKLTTSSRENLDISSDFEIKIGCNLMKKGLSLVLCFCDFMKMYDDIKIKFIQWQDGGCVGDAENGLKYAFLINKQMTIGYGIVSFKSLSNLMGFQHDVSILDHVSLCPIGTVKIQVVPCNEYFEELDDSQVWMTLNELEGRSLFFIVRLGYLKLPRKFKDVTCEYTVPELDSVTTEKLDVANSYANTDSIYQHQHRCCVESVTSTLMESLQKNLVIFTFYGQQRPQAIENQFSFENQAIKVTNGTQKFNLMQLRQSPYLGLIPNQTADSLVSKKAEARLRQKLDVIQKLIELSEATNQSSIPLPYLQKICTALDHTTAYTALVSFKDDFSPPEEMDDAPKMSTYQKVSEVCVIV